MKAILQVLPILLSSLSFAQEKTYSLSKKRENANINYDLLELFDSLEIYQNDGLKKAFEATEGNFTVYNFVSEFMGSSFTGNEKLFHDYLILKVDPRTQEIIDGYHYTMEWAEPPPVSDLYRVTAQGYKLSDGMSLDNLEMKLADSTYASVERMFLKDNGIIKIK